MRPAVKWLLAAAVVVAPFSTADAGLVSISQPDAAYVSDTNLIPVPGGDFGVFMSITDGAQTVNFDIPFVSLTVPGTWSAWGLPPDTEGSTPHVLWSVEPTTATLTFQDAVTFGFELEPARVAAPFTAEFFDGAVSLGSITRDVDAVAGARLFAATTTTGAFDRVIISGPEDFAIAQVRYAVASQAIPEPASLTVFLAACWASPACFAGASPTDPVE
jgi:hypothetical protein